MVKKKKITICIFSIILLVAGSIAAIYFSIDAKTKIDYDSFLFDKNEKHLISSQDRILWDTGADITALFKDLSKNKKVIFLTPVFDYARKISFYKHYFTKQIKIDSVLIKNLIYIQLDSKEIANGIQELNINGILGMNVIRKANWLIDFQENKVDILPFDSVITDYNSKIKLSYKKKKYPFVTLEIQGIKTKKMLLDTGYNCDIKLFKSDIEEINKQITPDSVSNSFASVLFTDSIAEKKYFYSNITINSYTFDNLTITESCHRRLFGMEFLRKFDKVFWDSKNKEVKFYKN